eukprot:gene17944-biopygen1321
MEDSEENPARAGGQTDGRGEHFTANTNNWASMRERGHKRGAPDSGRRKLRSHALCRERHSAGGMVGVWGDERTRTPPTACDVNAVPHPHTHPRTCACMGPHSSLQSFTMLLHSQPGPAAASATRPPPFIPNPADWHPRARCGPRNPAAAFHLLASLRFPEKLRGPLRLP